MNFKMLTADVLPDIKSDEDFLSKAPIGTTVYIIATANDEPVGVEELTISKYSYYYEDPSDPIAARLNGSLKVNETRENGLTGEPCDWSRFASDMTNAHHGVFLDKDKAHRVLEIRKEIWLADYDSEEAKLRRQLDQAFMDLLDDMSDRMYDDYYADSNFDQDDED